MRRLVAAMAQEAQETNEAMPKVAIPEKHGKRIDTAEQFAVVAAAMPGFVQIRKGKK